MAFHQQYHPTGATRPQCSASLGVGLGFYLSQLKKEWSAQLWSLGDLTTPWNMASDLQALFRQNIWDIKDNGLFTTFYLNLLCIPIATPTAVGSLSSCHTYGYVPVCVWGGGVLQVLQVCGRIGEGSHHDGHHLHHHSPNPGCGGRTLLLRADPCPLTQGPSFSRRGESCHAIPLPCRAMGATRPGPKLHWWAAAWAGAGGGVRVCAGVCVCVCVSVSEMALSPASLPRQRSPAPGGWWLSAQAD